MCDAELTEWVTHVHVHAVVRNMCVMELGYGSRTRHCGRAGANPLGVYACACAIAYGQHKYQFIVTHMHSRQLQSLWVS